MYYILNKCVTIYRINKFVYITIDKFVYISIDKFVYMAVDKFVYSHIDKFVYATGYIHKYIMYKLIYLLHCIDLLFDYQL